LVVPEDGIRLPCVSGVNGRCAAGELPLILGIIIIIIIIIMIIACGSVVVKALRYKTGGRGFET
jgi:hypothetical protein